MCLVSKTRDGKMKELTKAWRETDLGQHIELPAFMAARPIHEWLSLNIYLYLFICKHILSIYIYVGIYSYKR